MPLSCSSVHGHFSDDHGDEPSLQTPFHMLYRAHSSVCVWPPGVW